MQKKTSRKKNAYKKHRKQSPTDRKTRARMGTKGRRARKANAAKDWIEEKLSRGKRPAGPSADS